MRVLVPTSVSLLVFGIVGCSTTSPSHYVTVDASAPSDATTGPDSSIPTVETDSGAPFIEFADGASEPEDFPPLPAIDSGYFDAAADSTAFETMDGGPVNCNALTLNGMGVFPRLVVASAPPATGGSTVDGTYAMTNLTFYNPTPGIDPISLNSPTFQGTLQLSNNGTVVQLAQQVGNAPISRVTLSQTLTGTQATYTVLCGLATTRAWSMYTASPTTLMLYSGTGSVAVSTFTLQP